MIPLFKMLNRNQRSNTIFHLAIVILLLSQGILLQHFHSQNNHASQSILTNKWSFHALFKSVIYLATLQKVPFKEYNDGSGNYPLNLRIWCYVTHYSCLRADRNFMNLGQRDTKVMSPLVPIYKLGAYIYL